MIDEAGRVERHPSIMQLDAAAQQQQPRSPHQQQPNGGAAQRSQASLFGPLPGLDGDGEAEGDGEGQGERGGAAGGLGHAHKIKSNVKLARITEWVMTDGERYFRLEDVQDVGDTVYPFGPDLLMREDSRCAGGLRPCAESPPGCSMIADLHVPRESWQRACLQTTASESCLRTLCLLSLRWKLLVTLARCLLLDLCVQG